MMMGSELEASTLCQHHSAATTMIDGANPTSEALKIALTECQEQMTFHTRELERLEKEKKLLEEELRQAELEPKHARLAVINAAMHECLEDQKLYPDIAEDLKVEYQRLQHERKQVMLPDAESGEPSICPMTNGVWRQLSSEEQKQKGNVLAALRGRIFGFYVPELSPREFDRNYPELAHDRDIFLARLEAPNHLSDFPFSYDRAANAYLPFIIPTMFRDDQDIVLVVLRQSPQSFQFVSEGLKASPEFVAKVVELTDTMYSENKKEADDDGWYPQTHKDLMNKLLQDETSRTTFHQHPHLVSALIGKSMYIIEQNDVMELLDDVFSRDSWPCEVVHEWIRHRRVPFNHESFRGDDREVAIAAAPYEEFESFVSPELMQDKDFVVKAAEAGLRLDLIPEPMKQDVDVLVAATISYRFYYGEKISFDERFFRFGQDVREILDRRVSFRVFLEASGNLGGIILDEDTTAALLKQISSFVGVPSDEEVVRLRVALNEMKKIGF